MEAITFIVELCRQFPLSTTEAFPTLLVTSFITAFIAGFTHCSFMCGPLVMMQVSTRLENKSAKKMTELTRLKAAALLPYHLGRITTYMLLGGFFAWTGTIFINQWRPFAALFMLGAGLLIIFSAFHINFNFSVVKYITHLLKKIPFSPFLILFKNPTGVRGYILGSILGFLPCGLIYAALALAATTGSFLKGVFLLCAFGLGTIPSLFTVGAFTHMIMPDKKIKLYIFAKVATVIAGSWICIIALILFLT